MYEICWEFEESWNSGNCPPPQEWLRGNEDIPAQLLLDELTETQRELQAKRSRENSRPSHIHDDRYEFVEEIARGGAAVVWRVRDRHLQRETAVKYLLDSCDNHEMRSRLEREARLCARLVHPGIVPIHELSNFADGRPFVSMKLIEGKTLLQLINMQQRPSLKSLIEIFTNACQAIAHAHKKKIIHRDLKPGNIMVGAFGEVQIMDWGLAKELTASTLAVRISEAHVDTIREISAPRQLAKLDEAEKNSVDAIDHEETSVGTVCGTIAYMSPEQASGCIDSIDERSDVFALGAVLCRLLVGVPPYRESDRGLMLKKAQRGDMQTAMQALSRSPHRKLAALAISCLSIDPAKRPKDASELVEQLNTIQATELRRQHAFRFVSTASAIALVLIVSLFLRPTNHSTEAAKQAVPSAAIQPEVLDDPVVIKRLIASKSEDIAIKNYEAALAKNPDDAELHYPIGVVLLNKRRYAEAEAVFRKLDNGPVQKPSFSFMLSESLYRQGKFEQALKSLLKCQSLEKSMQKSSPQMEKNLARVRLGISLADRLPSIAPKDFPEANDRELLQIAEICDVRGFPILAIEFTDSALAKTTDEFQRSRFAYESLACFAHKHLTRSELTDATRNEILKHAIKLIEWQSNYATYGSSNRADQRRELIEVLKSGRDFESVYKAVDDPRIDSQVREQLKGQLERIREMHVSNSNEDAGS